MADSKNLNDFLVDVFQWKQLHDMFEYHPEQRAQFADYIDKNDLTSNMAKWVKNFIVKDANGKPKKDDVTHEYSLVDEPGIDALSNKDLENLYMICRDTFTQMWRFKDSAKPEVKDFIDRWSYLFVFKEEHADYVATPATNQQIQQLYDLLTKDPAKTVLQDKLSPTGEWSNILGADRSKRITYGDLVRGINDKKYNKTQEFQEIIVNLAAQIAKETDAYQNPKTAAAALKNLGLTERPHFDLIIGDGWEPYSVGSGKLDEFKKNYSYFLGDIYSDSKVLDEYKKHEGQNNQISTALENAISKTDYNNKESKDYVYPKRDDKLTPFQQISKWVSDRYDDSLKKYFSLRGDRLFFKNETSEVFKAISKSGIKPSDGLAKILENKDKIKTALGHSPTSNEAFNWLANTLTDFQKDPKMSKTLAGALKNGKQMRHLVQEMALTAITQATKQNGTQDEKVIANVKVAMEILSAIRYSLVTSKTMEALRDQTFSLFSDSKLSWNKNEGVQFVTNAVDKTIGFAFKTAAYGVTIGVNTIRRSRSKFNGQMRHGKKDKTGERFERAYNNWDAINTANKNAAQQRKIDYENSTRIIKDRAQQDADNAYRSLTSRRRNLDPNMQKSDVINMIEQELDTDGRREENVAFSKYQPLQQSLDDYNQMQQLADEAQEINNQIAAIVVPPQGTSEYIAAKEQIAILAKERADIAKQLLELNSYFRFSGLDANITANNFSAVSSEMGIQINNTKNNPAYQKAKNNYEQIVTRNDKKRNNIAIFRDASNRLKEIQDAQKKNEETVNKWDEKHKNYFKDLMNFWDMLDSGRATLTNSNTNETKTVNFAHNFMPKKKSKKQADLLAQLSNGYSLAY